MACSITREDIRAVWPANGRCPVFDEPLAVGPRTGNRDWAPSLDRIVPALGYVPGNIAVISHLANQIKTNATPAQVRAVADWLDREKL